MAGWPDGRMVDPRRPARPDVAIRPSADPPICPDATLRLRRAPNVLRRVESRPPELRRLGELLRPRERGHPGRAAFARPPQPLRVARRVRAPERPRAGRAVHRGPRPRGGGRRRHRALRRAQEPRRLERGPRLEPDTFSVTLKRNPYEVRSVSIVRMADSITGYLRLEDFMGNASTEVHDALKRLRGMHARQVVLDLRGNPGGSVIASVEIASEFFPKNTVVFRTRGRKRDVDTTFVTKRDGEFRDLPLLVLIDEGSASAAEALAGSLQDHDRALLLGRRSFGKALMQTDFFVPPSGEIVHLTIGHVLSPSGRFIQRRYRGVVAEQYYSLAGKGGVAEDTLKQFHTDAGRIVRGGGGITPDIELPRPASLPVWWSVAADSGFDDAISDSVAQTLSSSPAERVTWLTAREQWRTRLLQPFLTRVRARLKVGAQTDSALEARLALSL